MKRYLNLGKLKSRLIACVLLTSLLVSCSVSPEEYGRKMAKLDCKCDAMLLDTETKVTKDGLRNLKENKFGSQEEFVSWLASGVLSEKYRADSLAYQNCSEKLREMKEEVNLKYARDDDRKTVRNAFDAHNEVGQEKLSKDREALRTIQKEYAEQIGALPPQ